MAVSSPPADALLGSASGIAALKDQIRRLAPFDTIGSPHVPTVLLVGETGTGKGLVARVIHDSGPRAGGPFVDVNCGAIPDTMLEAELFGFEAGAFTDAKRAKPGLFEVASGGSLFLDEIDSLSLPVQSKVLKAIEEKRVRRLGAVAAQGVDIKLIAATQHDLTTLVGSGRFRADLYHRLAVLVLTIPPLRTRADDIVLLADHFLQRYAAAHNLKPKRLDATAAAWLRQYDWPGNVRELGHLMERVTLLCPDEAVDGRTLDALMPPSSRRTPAPQLATVTSEGADEADQIRDTLAQFGGNVVRAAKALGIGRNALRYRMRRFGIARPDTAEPAPITERSPPIPQPVSTTPEPPRWEQKSVTVLIVGITFPAGAGDASYDLWTAASRWERAIIERIEGFGGHVVDRSPSRFLALFGVPRALEQTSQRALHAARAIQHSVGHTTLARPEVRTVVHVGEARIDVAAADPLARILPIGDTLTLAERLLGHTGVGEVVVSAAAARRIERTWELSCRELLVGPHPADRLTAYSVVRQQPSVAQPVLRGATAFVGRERELGLLHDAFARATGGRGQAVFIAGDAGIGKSRLLAEFRQGISQTPHRWIEGRCAAYGAATPFLPIIDGMRRHLQIEDDDTEGGSRAKIGRELDRLGPEVAWADPFLRQLLSLDVDDEAVRALDSASRRSELFRALRALTLRAAEIEPLVLVIEDLHWIDLASEEYLAFVADVVPTAHLLLILTHRPGYQQPFGDRSYFARLSLPPLSSHDMTAITNGVLGSRDVPHDVRTLIAGKAEGNPFFVEELTKSLLEDGTLRRANGGVVLTRELDAVTIPDTIQDVLIARIDRLAEESRRAIQIASVIGREFALRLLARITDVGERIQTQVDELRGLELIYQKALHPELAYMFKHALTHDVAYESVIHERRAALHRTIGHTIEELYADRLAEHYETLALHFSRGQDWGRALLYLERSADKAAETHANRAVVEHCRQALAIADRPGARLDDEVRRRLNERLGRARFYLSEFVGSGLAYEEAARWCHDAESKALHLGTAAFSYFWGHDYAAARRCIDTALELARRHDSAAGEAMALNVQAFYRGVHDADLDAYERGSQQALALCGRRPNDPIEAFARFQLAQIAEWTGAYQHAIALAEQVILLGRKLRLSELIVFSAWFLGKARCCVGDFGGALLQLEEAYQVCDRIGDRAWKSRLLNTMGWCFAEIGSVERAQHCNEHAAALARELGDPEIRANADVNLAINALALGQVDRAEAQLEPVEAMLTRSTDPWMRWRYALHVHHARGRVALARGEPVRALTAADTELRGAEQYRAPKLAACAHLLRGAAFLAMDQRDQAEAAWHEARALAERIGYCRAQWEASRGLAAVAQRRGDNGGAANHLGTARDVAERAARSLTDPELRARLIASVTAIWTP